MLKKHIVMWLNHCRILNYQNRMLLEQVVELDQKMLQRMHDTLHLTLEDRRQMLQILKIELRHQKQMLSPQRLTLKNPRLKLKNPRLKLKNQSRMQMPLMKEHLHALMRLKYRLLTPQHRRIMQKNQRKTLRHQRLMLKHHQTTLLRLHPYQDHMLLALADSLEMEMQLTMQNIIVKDRS